MRIFTFVALIVLVGAGFLGDDNVLAYNQFGGSDNCSQCHSGFDSYGSSDHQDHMDITTCNACHASSGDNPVIATCSACHDANLLWNYHLRFAGPDDNDQECDACHSVTPNEPVNWDDVKSMYLSSLDK